MLAFSALKGYFNAEAAEIRRVRREIFIELFELFSGAVIMTPLRKWGRQASTGT